MFPDCLFTCGCSLCYNTHIKWVVMVLLMQQHETKNAFQSALAGGGAGAFTRAVAQPLDVVKIRFQLQLEPIKRGSKYSSGFQCITSIVREEGLSTLWSGHIPAQLLSITYGVLQFTTFDELTGLCQQVNPQFFNTHRHAITFTSGAVAATVATVVSFPFDTVRTRLIAEHKSLRAYKGFSHALNTMVRTEGLQALYKGLVPTLGQIAPHAGIQFAVYKFFTDNILTRIIFFQRSDSIAGTIESSLVANLISGSIAGFVAKTAIYPFDLVKKRMQIQGFQHHRKHFGKQIYCKGLFECIKFTINEEGYRSLYKGYWTSMFKAVFVSALHFSVYDEIKHYLMKLQS